MSSSGRLFLVRHTEKETNGADPDLSARGVEHAKQLELKTDTVIVSILRRALNTYFLSKIQCKTNLVLSTNARERIEGASTRLATEDVDFIESFELFVERVDRTVDLIRFHLQSGSVAIVSHEDFLHQLQKKLGVQDPQPMAMGEIRQLQIAT